MTDELIIGECESFFRQVGSSLLIKRQIVPLVIDIFDCCSAGSYFYPVSVFILVVGERCFVSSEFGCKIVELSPWNYYPHIGSYFKFKCCQLDWCLAAFGTSSIGCARVRVSF